jgi:ABC-type multidrug transport system ATPase subunit/ABC-type multidrug transport system permease subunit
MWGPVLPADTPKDEEDRERNPWHQDQRNGPDGETQATTSSGSPSESQLDMTGTWGERDAGNPRTEKAMEEFHALRQTLSDQERTKSHTHHLDVPESKLKEDDMSLTDDSAIDIEAAGGDDDFELAEFMKEGHFEKRKDGQSAKKVGVVWKNLTVKGVAATGIPVKTLPDAVIGTFGPDLYRIVSGFIPALKRKAPTRTLLHDFSGVVRDGEMMLVLGRPGSGCSTFLRTVANNREGYTEVLGDVSYGGISAEKQKKHYRGEVNYNPEDDIHYPTLNVWQTLYFALLNKTKKSEKANIPIVLDALLKMFGISHTKNTLVGNPFVPEVSGGERKRVSIAETLAGKSTVVCWDNSTRGLDASTALDYAKSLRIMTDISNRTTLVSLYQAGEGIYELMDKVMLIDQGCCIFQGPAREARQYFNDLGFYSPDRQTTADFLTSITDPTERRFREGYENSAPRTPEDLEKTFRSSTHYRNVLAEIDAYEHELARTHHIDAKEFELAVHESKSKTVQKKSSFTVSFIRQVYASFLREFWLTWADKTTIKTKFFVITGLALVVGSMFHGQSLGTAGAFTRGGSLFFSTIILGWLQLSELMSAMSGREVIKRHADYAFYHPSAVNIARVLLDIPYLLAQVIPFTIVLYFITGLDVEASKYFIYLLFIYTGVLCVTAMYRMFASVSATIDDAVRYAGVGFNVCLVTTGYIIPRHQLINDKIWFGWINYINPLGYAYEAAVTNEFGGRTLECESAQLVPNGPGIDPAFQGCALRGAEPNSRTVSGDSYLSTAFGYSRSHLWRNFGIILALTVGYIVITVIFTEAFSFASGGGGALVFKKSRRLKKTLKASLADEEKVMSSEIPSSTTSSSGLNKEEALEKISNNESVFTWKDVHYSIPAQGGDKLLLNKVSGYAKPGVMIALMGASGAGKTTLLNTLSQRQTVGVVSGEMLVDGRPLEKDFQRGTGFCEQQDVHDETATIREALEFSAILRQPRDTPKAEKIAYVDKIIDLLELQDIQDAIISSLGVEQKKRLTIGVELAAKPSLLLFLDEPTSGLDSNSAYSIVRFLKKLSAAGQAILCTIHQPSSILVQQFDMILALDHGGNMYYFGPVGHEGQGVVDYFGKRGAHCPPKKNVAEFILEMASKSMRRPDGTKVNWNEEWKNSQECQELYSEIEQIKADRSKVPKQTDKVEYEFAAPVWLQITTLTERTFRQFWRDPSYIYGKLWVAFMIGVFNGFTFWMLGNSIQDMQNRAFTTFFIIVMPPAIINGVLPKFFGNMMIWQGRELPSRIYGWVAFTTAQVIAEIPFAILSGVIYYVVWYFPTGLPTDASTAGYAFLMTVLYYVFTTSWGQWITAWAPSFTVVANVLPFLLVICALFNGVMVPWSHMVFWKWWVYYLNPTTYFIGGMLAATLHGQQIVCEAAETTVFNVPSGQTCAQYASEFLARAPGYLMNPNATTGCQYCPYSTGDDYLATLNIKYSDKWRNFGIYLAFCISNWALVYFFVWACRIKGWGFGFGHLSRGVAKVLSLVSFGKL